MNGVIKNINDKGFGFITVNGGEDHFIHKTSMAAGFEFSDLEPGDRVQFVSSKSPKGLRAEQVVILP